MRCQGTHGIAGASTFGPVLSFPLGHTGGPTGSHILTTRRSLSRPRRRSMGNLLPRHPTRLLLPLLTGTTVRSPRVTIHMCSSALGAGDQSPRLRHRHRAGPITTLTSWCGNASVRQRDHTWRRGRRRWRGWDRPGRWACGYARHLIPSGIHTLDIRHVIPGLQGRCRGAAG